MNKQQNGYKADLEIAYQKGFYDGKDEAKKEIKKAELRGKIEVLHKMITRLENICPLNTPTPFQAGHLNASKYLLLELRELELELKKTTK